MRCVWRWSLWCGHIRGILVYVLEQGGFVGEDVFLVRLRHTLFVGFEVMRDYMGHQIYRGGWLGDAVSCRPWTSICLGH